jgi:alpha-ribazole phosphatase/probable phosphoglycerate mutase
MSELLFIRHAETDMAGTFCGHSDPPLNERGREQMGELISSLCTEAFDAIYSSDLQRAASTARALAASVHLPVTLSSGLREIHFGDWEGLAWSEIEQRDPAWASRWIKQYPKVAAPAGESFTGFEARVLDEVRRLSGRTDHHRIAVVTHAGVMRVVLRELCGLDEQAAWERTKCFCCCFLYSPHEGLREVQV